MSGPGLTASFHYDSAGRRINKTINGASTSYLYDGANVVQELTGGTPTANLLTGGVDKVLTRNDGSGTRTPLIDGLGSTLALADDTGTLQTQYTYDPFGNTTSTGTTSTNSSKYTGREEDGIGLYYYRARYYSPGLQRFISEDPIGFGGGDVNSYAYVGNDPINSVDPSGLCSVFSVEAQTPCEKKLAAIFGGPGAIMRTRYDYNGVYRGQDDLAALVAIANVSRNGMPNDFDPIWDAEHLYNSPHLSGNLAGTANTEIYVPGNYVGQPTSPSPNAGVVLIYYPQLGNLTNVTLAIYHVGNFNVRREGDRVRIGTTGGPGGGQGGNYNLHSHFEIWNGRHTRVLEGRDRFAVRTQPFTAAFCP